MTSLRALRWLRWLLLGLAILVPVVVVVLPTSTMYWLRRDHVWIGRPLFWLDWYSTAWLDLTHVALFVLISWCVACLWPRVVWWHIVVLMLVLGMVGELLQFWVPGRTPRVSDLLDDMLGVALGLLLAWPVRRWVLRRSPAPGV